MLPRRRLLAAVGATVALAGLAGCEKPTPIVTLYSGDTSVYDDAFSYCFSGQDPAAQPGSDGACRVAAGSTPKVLRVRPGDTVTVDVDKDLADAGWYVALRGANGQGGRLATQDGHVATFQPDFNSSPTITVQIAKVRSTTTQSTQAYGLWQFVIAPK